MQDPLAAQPVLAHRTAPAPLRRSGISLQRAAALSLPQSQWVRWVAQFASTRARRCAYPIARLAFTTAYFLLEMK